MVIICSNIFSCEHFRKEHSWVADTSTVCTYLLNTKFTIGEIIEKVGYIKRCSRS